MNRAGAPIYNLLRVANAPKQIVWRCSLMTRVAANGCVALPHRLRHITIAQGIAVTAVACCHELTIPSGGRKPDLEMDDGIATRSNYRLHAAEGGQISKRWCA